MTKLCEWLNNLALSSVYYIDFTRVLYMEREISSRMILALYICQIIFMLTIQNNKGENKETIVGYKEPIMDSCAVH
jgi:hypothetical protein